MKNILFALVFLLTTQTAISQIKLEKTFENYSLPGFRKFTHHGYKLVYTDQKKIVIYNDDYTIFKTIDIKIPESSNPNSPYNVLYVAPYIVSDNLFNLDDKIEYYITYYSTDNYIVRVYNELGAILFEKSSSKNLIPSVTTTDKEAKFVLTYYEGKTEIYSLPGNLPLEVTEVTKSKSDYDVKLYPNPTSQDKINIAFTLPDNIKIKKINIYNTLGQVVKTVKPDGDLTEIDIDTQNLQKGTYFCELIGNKGKISASKFVVQ